MDGWFDYIGLPLFMYLRVIIVVFFNSNVDQLVKELSFKIKYYYWMESKELSIVIVTYKSEGKIYNCLDSIPNNIKVKIVENSNDKNFKRM